MKTKRGALIVFEGCDRVGKSTQVKLLVEELTIKNMEVASFRFPDRTTTIGKKINQLLTHKEVLDKKTVPLLFAENRREHEPEMRRLLSQGTTLLVDRYSYSGVAFAAANQCDKQWCWQNEIGLPKPDLVLFLRMSPKKAALRNGYGNELYEKLDFQEKVSQEYKEMMDSTWRVIDVDDKDIDTVKTELLEHIISTISQVGYTPLCQFSMQKENTILAAKNNDDFHRT